MKKSVSSLLLLLLFAVFSCHGQKKLENSEHSLFWEISGNGLQKPSYLYGTIHIADKRVFEFDKSVLKALNSCEVVTGEIIMDMSQMFGAIHMIFMPDGIRLSELFENENDYALVQKEIKTKLGFMAGMADSLKPIFTATLLSEGEIASDMSITLDEFFQKEGKAEGKTIKGLETMEEQMSALDKIPLTDQAKMLLSSIEEESKEDGLTTEKMVQAYLDQDLLFLQEMIKESDVDDVVQNELLTKRNINMAERINLLAQEQPTFNTFGAGHLIGKEGIVQLLRDMGYMVTPLKLTFNSGNLPKSLSN